MTRPFRLVSWLLITFPIALTAAAADRPDAPTLGQYVIEQGIDETAMPIIAPTVVYHRLGERGEHGRELQDEFLFGLLNDMGSKVHRSYFDRMIRSIEQTKLAPLFDRLFGLFDARSAAKHPDLSPDILDEMITLDLGLVHGVQALFFKLGEEAPHHVPAHAFDLKPERRIAADWQVLDFSADRTCPRPERVKDAWFLAPELKLMRGIREPNLRMDGSYASVTPCYDELSRKLAYVINLLSNTVRPGASDQPGGVDPVLAAYRPAANLSILVRRKGHGEYTVGNYDELLRALGRLGLSVDITGSRRFANFRGMTIELDGQWHGVLDVAWMKMIVDGREVKFPSEHSDINLLVHDGRVRYANLAYYFGVEDKDDVVYDGNAALWRADTELEWTSAKPVVFFSVPYGPEHVAEARPWLDNAADVTRAVKAIGDRYGLPFNSYAQLVCSDASALVLAKMAEIPGTRFDRERVATGRISDAFPLWRSRLVEADLFRVGAFSAAARARVTKFYPPDHELLPYATWESKVLAGDFPLARDSSAIRARLKASFPWDAKTRQRFSHIPQVLEDLRFLHGLSEESGAKIHAD